MQAGNQPPVTEQELRFAIVIVGSVPAFAMALAYASNWVVLAVVLVVIPFAQRKVLQRLWTSGLAKKPNRAKMAAAVLVPLLLTGAVLGSLVLQFAA